MKTRDIAYSGLMIALFLSICFAFRTNIRVVQTYLEIIKVIIVAVFIRNIERKNWWVSASACFLICLLLVSVPDTLIYNVPSIVCGCVIGLQKERKGIVRNYLFFFIIHSLMLIYEFAVFGFFMQTNLFTLYQEQAATVLSEITSGMISVIMAQALFIAFMIFDSAFSSFVIFSLSQIAIKKLNGVLRTSNAE